MFVICFTQLQQDISDVETCQYGKQCLTRILFVCFPLPFWVSHVKVSVISGTEGVQTTRTLGHDTEGELKGYPWLHIAVHHSLEGNGRPEEGEKMVKNSDIAPNTSINLKQFKG